MSSSREIVLKTLNFENPGRVAHSFAESDFINCGAAPKKSRNTDWEKVDELKWIRYDAWGNMWSRIDPTSCGEVEKGVIEDLDKLDEYEFPDFESDSVYDGVREKIRENPGKFIIGGVPGMVFNIARKMRRLDQYLVDILLEPEKISMLNDRVESITRTIVRKHAEAGVDAVFFTEDWGTQTQTLISPELWRKEFFPRFKRVCGLAHELGIKTFMHSCGQIEAIVPGLIEAGIDCLQFDQPELHGLDVLASHQENAKITFWSPVDIQTTLQTKDEAKIRATVREMLDKLWKGRGGYIAGFYGDNASIGLEPEWQEIASDEFTRYGVKENFPG